VVSGQDKVDGTVGELVGAGVVERIWRLRKAVAWLRPLATTSSVTVAIDPVLARKGVVKVSLQTIVEIHFGIHVFRLLFPIRFCCFEPRVPETPTAFQQWTRCGSVINYFGKARPL